MFGDVACPSPCIISTSTCHPSTIQDRRVPRFPTSKSSRALVRRCMGSGFEVFQDFVKIAILLSNPCSTCLAFFADDHLPARAFTYRSCAARRKEAHWTVNPATPRVSFEAVAKTDNSCRSEILSSSPQSNRLQPHLFIQMRSRMKSRIGSFRTILASAAKTSMSQHSVNHETR